MSDNKRRDRGNIKWTSLMLPEHVQILKEMWKEDERVEKGVLEEDQAVEIDFKLQMAIKDDLTVKVKYHNEFGFSYSKVKIISIDRNQMKLNGIDQDTKDSKFIMLNNIIAVDIL
ncbi:YolD-like family protein [Pontibacillus sp. HMF3514]|uniref:YolD-like family protein n=1 Tax=Pontibacillus sp. HMF3514 TaxID=2692425 RepID=UPI00131FC9C1|nr:YolD-like family protein [Pontibacillus sp. HMF3514]QHE52944.1 YolD-like family protein [Pontibacillus sp. HMF3514]